MSNTQKSSDYFERACALIPDGVSSPMRRFLQVEGNPVAVRRAHGSQLEDIDGNIYTDFLCGFGAIFLGHNHEHVRLAMSKQIEKSPLYGLSCELEAELAEKIVRSTSTVEMVRFTCSGSEAVMTAMRIARANTGRRLIIKFIGSYHGHADVSLAMPNDNQINTKGASSGVMDSNVAMCHYNDEEQLKDIFEHRGGEIAAVIVEPIATNMGLVTPSPTFHQTIRSLCDNYGALLIFDEVVTGFRFRYGGVSDMMGVEPDLTTFGKIIGGGCSIGAYGGRSELMKSVQSGKGVFQSGTFSANPLTMAAGNAALEVLSTPGFYDGVNSKGDMLKSKLQSHLADQDIPFLCKNYGALIGVAFRSDEAMMNNYTDVKTQQYDLHKSVHRSMMSKGFMMPPSLEEPIFLTAAHSEEQISSFAKNLAITIAEAVCGNPEKEILSFEA